MLKEKAKCPANRLAQKLVSFGCKTTHTERPGVKITTVDESTVPVKTDTHYI
jgi:hypothetical protein